VTSVAETLEVARVSVDGTCPSCGHAALARYPLLGEGGWFVVVKCQDCLTSLSREPGRYLPDDDEQENA
jgi:predicted RNA-binding Zn-ribbon protein involved in translation (DUF1610 family)